MDACRMPCPLDDKHSKVLTAKGVRDRRIRLSPETASKFFELHHRLGFDHPTKSVEWLLKQSRSTIDGLPELFHFHDYLHDSGTGIIDESDLVNPCFDASYLGLEWEDGSQWPFCSTDNGHDNGMITSRPVGVVNPEKIVERRTKARERARQRTKEKNNSR